MTISLKNYVFPYLIAVFFIIVLVGATSFLHRGEGAEITGAASVPDELPIEEEQEINQSIELVEENNSVGTGNSS